MKYRSESEKLALSISLDLTVRLVSPEARCALRLHSSALALDSSRRRCMVKVVSIELNELDFELLQGYVRDGSLPTFQRLMGAHDLVPTIAETDAAHLEPWIQRI